MSNKLVPVITYMIAIRNITVSSPPSLPLLESAVCHTLDKQALTPPSRKLFSPD